jgi:periplasmic protein TonB
MHPATHPARPTHQARSGLHRRANAREGAVGVVPLCVAGSLLVHAAAFAAVRAGGPDVTDEPGALLAMVDFEVQPPEPEPVAEPEPEMIVPQVVPERRAVIAVRERPEPVTEPEPEQAKPEPELAKARADAEPRPNDATDTPFEEEGSPDALAGHGIASTEGGLAVAARGGDGSGLRGGDSFKRGRPVPQAPAIDIKDLYLSWMSRVSRIIIERAARDYPAVARSRNLSGVAVVAVFVDADGRITSVKVKQSSGHALLDKAALAAVSGVGRVPAPPAALGWQGARPIAMPVNYQLR